MASPNDTSFAAQQRAIERMMEMNARSNVPTGQHPTPPMPSFVQLTRGDGRTENTPTRENAAKENPAPPSPQTLPKSPQKSGAFGGLSGLFSSLGLGSSDSEKPDRDLLLILGVGYLLYKEQNDHLLLLALLYILL